MTKRTQKTITTEEINRRLEAINARGAKIMAAVNSWIETAVPVVARIMFEGADEPAPEAFLESAAVAGLDEEDRVAAKKTLDIWFPIALARTPEAQKWINAKIAQQ